MDLIKAIDLGTEKNAERERRSYIGASNVGNPCEAALQYSLRGYPQKSIPAAVLRIFELGHDIEEKVVKDLKQAGVLVYEVDPKTKKQWEYTAFGGHLRGHADGVMATDKDNPTPAILEIKSMNDKKWTAFKTRGVYYSHPVYFAQVQLLMGLAGYHESWVIAYNKNTSVYHAEHIEFDYDYYIRLLAKTNRVVRYGSAKRVSNNPLAFECRYCNFKPHCWPHGETSLPISVECKTCKHAKPVAKRKWFCTKHGSRATEPCSHWYKVESTEAEE